MQISIPNHNKKNYFFESINSVLNQTHTNLEIIIIYDDENKNDLEHIKNCIKNDTRVKIIFNDNNKGGEKGKTNKLLRLLFQIATSRSPLSSRFIIAK